MVNESTVIDWLLDSDPAIRWQVLRDLTDASADDVATERARITTEGWGATLLALRNPDGQWAGGACFPGDYRGGGEGQPWTSTLSSLELLWGFGIDPDTPTMRDAVALARDNCRWEYNNGPFFDGEVEPCINGRTVGIGAYFGQNVDGIVTRLLNTDQLDDGGWNCETERGATVSSFHSTINVLEGLLAYERAGGAIPVSAARARGDEYLLERSLMRGKSTGELISPAFAEFSFPTHWYYDVLRALDYFRDAGNPPDERMNEAINLVRSKQQPDGTWLLENTHPGAVHFLMEADDGQPSRWNTLRALRVLRWADAA